MRPLKLLISLAFAGGSVWMTGCTEGTGAPNSGIAEQTLEGATERADRAIEWANAYVEGVTGGPAPDAGAAP